jgi:Bacteriophage Sf6, terminase small subunit-like
MGTALAFKAQYARAREVGYHKLADELLDIADDATNDFVERQNREGDTVKVFDAEHVQRSRLRVEARKWLLSKALPKVYGDKLELGGSIGLKHEGLLDKVAQLEAGVHPQKWTRSGR